MKPKNRIRFLQAVISLLFLSIIARLFHWQIASASKLQALANIQQETTIEVPASRGEILTTDGFPLVTNQPAFLVFAYTPDLEQTPQQMAQLLAPHLAPEPESIGATPSAKLEEDLLKKTQEELESKLTKPKLSWIPLARQINEATKTQVETLDIPGIGFEEFQVRDYPEASMAAQLTGFVGSDGTGKPKGYFGLEGHYNLELTGKPGIITQEKDPFGQPIVIGDFQNLTTRPGRTLITHLDRSLQLVVERKLSQALKKYGASKGEVIIMRPQDGAILTLASLPGYDQQNYKQYDADLHKMPSIANSFEPGSIFKAIVMAAAINEGVISPHTHCDSTCDEPVTIGKYTIRTWNDTYHSGQTMTDVLRHSDNTGMIFVANKLGKQRFVDYLTSFGFGQETGIDLQSESIPKLRDRWGDVDLATGSFGQGIAVTSMQMVRAMAAIANQGKLVTPQVVDQVKVGQELVDIKPEINQQVISPQAAQTTTEMLTASAAQGEAQWAFKSGYKIAGKTGTAQIPLAGHYDEEKTIASFIGFAPADNPQFVMLVKLREPTSSPWASETAAPLWMDIAQELYLHLSLPKN